METYDNENIYRKEEQTRMTLLGRIYSGVAKRRDDIKATNID